MRTYGSEKNITSSLSLKTTLVYIYINAKESTHSEGPNFLISFYLFFCCLFIHCILRSLVCNKILLKVQMFIICNIYKDYIHANKITSFLQNEARTLIGMTKEFRASTLEWLRNSAIILGGEAVNRSQLILADAAAALKPLVHHFR